MPVYVYEYMYCIVLYCTVYNVVFEVNQAFCRHGQQLQTKCLYDCLHYNLYGTTNLTLAAESYDNREKIIKS